MNGGDIHQAQPVLTRGVPVGRAAVVFVMLHGRGGSAEDILSLADAFGGERFAFLAPQAAGHTWYPLSFLAPRAQNEPYLSSALGKVGAVVDAIVGEGATTDRIVICGFSQGACLATEFVASNPRRYAGLIAFTGGLIGPAGSDITHAGDLAGTPAFLGSGDPDPHVPWTRVEESARVLEQMGAKATLKRYPGMPHTISIDEIESAKAVLGIQ